MVGKLLKAWRLHMRCRRRETQPEELVVRLNRYQLFVMGGLALIILGPAAFTQPDPGRGGRGGPGGGMGRGMFDPETIFKQYSGGADVIDVANVKVPQMMSAWVTEEQLRERFQTYLQKKG